MSALTRAVASRTQRSVSTTTTSTSAAQGGRPRKSTGGRWRTQVHCGKVGVRGSCECSRLSLRVCFPPFLLLNSEPLQAETSFFKDFLDPKDPPPPITQRRGGAIFPTPPPTCTLQHDLLFFEGSLFACGPRSLSLQRASTRKRACKPPPPLVRGRCCCCSAPPPWRRLSEQPTPASHCRKQLMCFRPLPRARAPRGRPMRPSPSHRASSRCSASPPPPRTPRASMRVLSPPSSAQQPSHPCPQRRRSSRTAQRKQQLACKKATRRR